MPIPLEGTPEGKAFTSRQTVLIRKSEDTAEFPAEIVQTRLEAAGLKIWVRRSADYRMEQDAGHAERRSAYRRTRFSSRRCRTA